MHWYVVHTKPRQESRALLNLELQGYGCFLPTLPKKKILKKTVEVTQEPLFPRYLFISLDVSASGKSWVPIRSTLGVSKLVTFGTEPVRVAPDLIESLKTCHQTIQTAPSPFTPGERVQLKEGPFANIDVLYQMEDGDSRAFVLIELLQKTTCMSVPLINLRKAS